VSTAGLLAFAAGAAAVLGAWEALADADGRRVGSWLGRAAAPVVRAGEEGSEPTARERRRLGVLAAAVMAGGGWLLAGVPVAIAAGLAGPAAAAGVVRARRRSFSDRLACEAASVARALADGLSSGSSIRAALTAAGAGMGGAAGAALRETGRALALGETTDAALERLRRRAGSPAWDTLVAAILLQRDAGGDLAGLLRDLATSLEAAERIERDARTATAQARFTAWLVGLLPVGGVAVAELAAPGFVAGLLAHPVSLSLAAAAAVLQGIGLVAVRRLAR
jgi:tight adherence protein B